MGYRNTFLAHGAPGQLSADFHQRMAAALLAGVPEVLTRLDVLAGGRLLYVAEVRQSAGRWLVHRFDLMGPSPRRVESLELPRDATDRLPDPEAVVALIRWLAAGPWLGPPA